MRKWLNVLLYTAMGLLAWGSLQNDACAKEKIKIGLSLPTQRDERWVRDRQKFEEMAKQNPDVQLLVQVCDNDATKQLSQCENLLAKGIDVLILAPHDAVSAAGIVDRAHADDVPVLSYDRLVMDSPDLALYVSFDNEKVGELQGEYLVKVAPKGKYAIFAGSPTDNNASLYRSGALKKILPSVASGDIKIVSDQWITDWQPTIAMNLMQNILTENKNDIQAVLAPNDNTAGGIIQALEGVGLAGKVPVTGQDAEATAAQRIVQGTQSMTVFKDTRKSAAAAFEAAVKLAKKENPGATSKINNKKKDVPAILLTATVVTKDNIDKELIDSGYLKKSQVYGK